MEYFFVNTSHSSKRLLTLSLVFTALVAIVAGYLLWATTGERQVAGCGEGSGCDAVLGSRWAGSPTHKQSPPAWRLSIVCVRLCDGEGLSVVGCQLLACAAMPVGLSRMVGNGQSDSEEPTTDNHQPGAGSAAHAGLSVQL